MEAGLAGVSDPGATEMGVSGRSGGMLGGVWGHGDVLLGLV